MIEEVKRLKLAALKQQNEDMQKQRHLFRQRLEELEEQLRFLQKERESISKEITIRNDFSLWEKWITRRADYKLLKTQSKRFKKLSMLIRKANDELLEEEKKVNNNPEALEIDREIQEIDHASSLICNAHTLYEMGITPTEAIEFLESNGIQPTLSESDKQVTLHPREYSSKLALICVHKTMYAPTANMIKSSKDSNVEYKKDITINGIKYEYSYKSARDTVHMAMNDEVSSHAFGSWENCPYAILIPFDEIPNSKIGRATEVDTFTRGSIELSENTWLLCPKKEVNRLKVFNPKVHILGYEGENVLGFSQPFLTQLGYRAEDVGMWGWRDNESSDQFRKLMAKEGIKFHAHAHTSFYADEKLLEEINKAVSLMRLLRDNHLIKNPEDIDNIMGQLEDGNQSFRQLLSGLLYVGSTPESEIESQSIIGNHKQVDVFLEELKKSGFNISKAYQDVMKNLCKMPIINGNLDNIFNISGEISEEERKTIEGLKTGLHDYYNIDSAYGKFLSTVIGDAILHSQEVRSPNNEL